MKVEVHIDHFGAEEDDDSWIPKCVAHGWIIISADQAIETDPINRKAVEDSLAKVFITADNNSKSEEWAAAIILGRRKLARTVDRNDGPFFVSIEKYATNHITSIRYVGTGAPKPTAPEAEKKQVVETKPEQASKPEPEERQQELFTKKTK